MSVTIDEVKKHNRDKDRWVIIGDAVFDMTNFLAHRPGDVHRKPGAGLSVHTCAVSACRARIQW